MVVRVPQKSGSDDSAELGLRTIQSLSHLRTAQLVRSETLPCSGQNHQYSHSFRTTRSPARSSWNINQSRGKHPVPNTAVMHSPRHHHVAPIRRVLQCLQGTERLNALPSDIPEVEDFHRARSRSVCRVLLVDRFP